MAVITDNLDALVAHLRWPSEHRKRIRSTDPLERFNGEIVSGSFERFLIARGDRVVRVPTRLMANTRRSSRQRGKSDRIDALAVARAALAEGHRDAAGRWRLGDELCVRPWRLVLMFSRGSGLRNGS